MPAPTRPASARLAVFDLDDTLVDSAGAIDGWFRELVAERGLGPEGLDFLRAEQQRPVPPADSLQAIVDHFGFPETAAELEAMFRARQYALTAPFPSATDRLRDLRRAGWRTALLTNGSRERQRHKMGPHFDDLFDATVFAYDEAASKPQPAAFELAARLAGSDLEGAWMVGDSWDEDIVPAHGLGMSTVWVSASMKPPLGDAVRATAVVATVAEAFDVLEAAAPASLR